MPFGHDPIAFRHIRANTNPDHDTIAAFRKRFQKELEALFIDIPPVLRQGCIDGTKIRTNTNRHNALSRKYANQLEAQLKGEVEKLIRLVEEAGQISLPGTMNILQKQADFPFGSGSPVHVHFITNPDRPLENWVRS